MAHSPHISLIFVNYHSAWSLSLALQSLFSLEREKELFEVIVVNNDLKESRVLKEMTHLLPFQLIENSGNVGFGQGANKGVAVATGSVVGLLNPDIVWQEPTLTRLKDFFLKQGSPTILGLRLLDEDGEEEAWSSGQAPQLQSLLWNNTFQKFLPKKIVEHEVLDWVSGCGLFLPKSTFLGVGGFDEDFFLYFEDVDFCLRAKRQGVAIVRDPDFTLMHRGGKSFSSHLSQKKHFYLSQRTFFKKHRPSFEFSLLRFFQRFFRGL